MGKRYLVVLGAMLLVTSASAGTFSSYTAKTVPVTADKMLVADSEAAEAVKSATVGSLPVSSATQTALDAKQATLPAGASSDDFLYWDGDSWEPYTVEAVGAYISGTEADIVGTFLNPQGLYDNDATNHAVTLMANTQAAFTISKILLSCDADPTTEITVTFQHKAAGVGYGTPTTIEAVTTTAGAATITTGIDDATIPAGVKVFATLSDPDDALNECAFQIVGVFD